MQPDPPATLYAMHLNPTEVALAGFCQRFGADALYDPASIDAMIGWKFWVPAKLKDMTRE
jgi:hypothetical protein